MENEFEKQKEVIESQKNQLEQQNQKIENQKKEFELQNQKNEIQKKELEEKLEHQKIQLEQEKEENKRQNNEIQKLNNQIKRMNESNISNKKKTEKNIHLMKKEIGRIQTDLDLIKSRGAIKVFIEFFYRGFKLHQIKSKGTKVDKILIKLNDYSHQPKNIEVINMIRRLLINSV